MKNWTIKDIRDTMNETGSYWWSKDTMSFFGTKIIGGAFNGPGGVFLVSSEQKPSGRARRFTVRQYNPKTKRIQTVGDFCELDRVDALSQAKQLAKGDDNEA